MHVSLARRRRYHFVGDSESSRPSTQISDDGRLSTAGVSALKMGKRGSGGAGVHWSAGVRG